MVCHVLSDDTHPQNTVLMTSEYPHLLCYAPFMLRNRNATCAEINIADGLFIKSLSRTFFLYVLSSRLICLVSQDVTALTFDGFVIVVL